MSRPPNALPEPEPELELDWSNRARRDVPESAFQPVAAQQGAPGKGMPGDPQHMSLELRLALAGLLEGGGLRVQQQKEWAEILVGWETRNRYLASDLTGRPVVWVGETGEGWGQSLLRNFWPFHRVRMECMTQAGTRALAVERPWTFFFARADVTAWDGRVMGHVQQRWSFFGRRLALLSPAGVELATVEGPWFKPWTFYVKVHGEEVAVIRKKWSGLAQEFFTQADNFGVEFNAGCKDARLRQLILAATLLVDLTYFEQRGRSRTSGNGLGLLAGLFD